MKSIQMQYLGQHVSKYVEKVRNIKPMHLNILGSDNHYLKWTKRVISQIKVVFFFSISSQRIVPNDNAFN